MIYRRISPIYLIFPLAAIAGVVKINQKIFVDVESMSFVDPQKQGLMVVLSENFVKNYLQDNQFPTLFVSAIPLRKGSHDRVTKVLYPELIQEGRMITLEGLKEKSWYYGCVEFENFNRQNESTGTSCKLFRTLDKFGKIADSVVSDVRIIAQSDNELKFKLTVDSDYPTKFTVYLSKSGAAAKIFLSQDPTTLIASFDQLQPETDYGGLCVLEEPVVAVYTAMGRLINNKMDHCYLSNLKTKQQQLSAAAQPHVQRLENSRLTSDYEVKGGSSMKSLSLITILFSILVMHLVSPIACPV